MAGYHERLRDPDNTRYLLRDFLVYGCRTRGDYAPSGARTYDNDRRRVEALLGNYLKWQYDKTGKHFFVSMDASQLSSNPLHRMYSLSTFTDNDILLHFFLLDALANGTPRAITDLTEAVFDASGVCVEEMTVRRKLNAYVKLGILTTVKQGKKTLYTIAAPSFEAIFPDDDNLQECLSFYRESEPFGCIADELMTRYQLWNDFIRFKHHFLMYTLDDIECLRILEAMRARRAISAIVDKKDRDRPSSACRMLPVSIRVSQQTGRRYLIGYDLEREAPRTLRMDLLHRVTLTEAPENADALIAETRRLIERLWGISLPAQPREEYFALTLRVDPETEPHILARLKREARGGSITQLSHDTFRYENRVLDTGEALPWIRSFTGRIISLEGNNTEVIDRFYSDQKRMEALYPAPGKGGSHGTV